MQLSASSRVSGPAALIAAITLIMLGAMAFAVPPSRIEVSVIGVERGYLVSHTRLSATLAQNVAADGYTYLAIDLTTAGDAALWSRQLDRVNEVQFPVWAWIDLGGGDTEKKLRELLPGLNLSGVFLAGPGAVARARQFAAANPSLTVLPVVSAGAERPEGPCAVAFSPEAFREGAKGAEHPVLLGAGLELGELEAVRQGVEGNYLVATVAVGR